jgi:glutamate formiminotransferase/formiminotetrahydrofolate cyclodeaminase
MALIACVPNISEGRDKKIIKAIVKAVEQTPGVKVLGVDCGFDVNRTVITFVGQPEKVEEGAYACIKKSYELIDMSKHHGKHIRMGCVDVCPFIPIEKATIDDCAAIASSLGARIGSDFGIPVYLYGHAASTFKRQDLAFIRRGEYEHLAIKLQNTPPDFGTSNYNEIVKKSGAISIGARNVLIAYNINLNTKDLDKAKEIAAVIRESGLNHTGDGMLKAVKAIGWYIEEYGRCQVSINLEDYKKTPLYLVYETCVSEAKKRGITVTGSELIGFVPKEVMLDTAKYYLNRQGRITLGMSMRDIMNVVVENLGLDDIAPFHAEERVLELKLKSLNIN